MQRRLGQYSGYDTDRQVFRLVLPIQQNLIRRVILFAILAAMAAFGGVAVHYLIYYILLRGRFVRHCFLPFLELYVYLLIFVGM